MKVYIPLEVEKIIRESLLKETDFIRNTESENKKVYKLLISLWFYVYNRQITDESVVNLNSYTSINNKSLDKFKVNINQKKYGYKYFADLLEKASLIDVNKKYSTGRFCKSYRILTSILNGNFEEVEINYKKVFCNMKNQKYWLKKYPCYTKQIMDSYKVSIDLTMYYRWLKENKGMLLKPILKNGIVIKRELNDERIYKYLNSAIKINYKNLWFKISDEGRFYSSLTNISYTALQFTKLGDKGIREVDVKNCQPLLLSSLIENPLYRKDVERGVFYDVMAKSLGKTRNEFKVLSYQYVFFSNRKLKQGKIYNALNKLYPGFVNQINKLREKIHISRKLQSLEAQIMVDKIGSLKYDMMLRHDAVFVYPEDYDIICQYVKLEFRKLGLKVQIK